MKKHFLNLFIIFLLFYNSITSILPISESFSYVDELITIFMFILVFARIMKTQKISLKKPFNIMEILLLMVVILGLLGNFTFSYMDNKIVIIKDILQFLKFPLLLIILIKYDFWDVKENEKDNLNLPLFKALIYIIFVCGIISMFKNIGMSTDEMRFGLHGYSFIFIHPTYLVVFCVIMLALFLTNGNSYKKMSFIEFILLSIIAMTLRTKGFMFIAIYIFIKFFYDIFKKNKIILFSVCIILALIVASGKINLYLSYNNSPRQTLYYGSFKLANQGVIYGSGFGTFGSILSYNSNSAVYRFINIPFYWVNNRLGIEVLGDAGLTYYLGQFGYLGFFFFIMCLYLITKYILTNINNKIPIILILIYIIIAILTESILTNLGMELAFFISYIYSCNKKLGVIK